MIEHDRVITVDLERGGKIIGMALAVGEYPEEGAHDDSKLWVVYMLEHNLPEEACKDFSYFMTNYWFNIETASFVKVKSEQPNEYAVYNPKDETWSWDAASVLVDIRRERDSKLKMSDWTQLSDTNLTAEQKAAAVDYRRELRDVTKDIGNPVNAAAIDWPTVPDFLQ